jgi:peptidoglycan/LPS O-acetylase OafA/YrhL
VHYIVAYYPHDVLNGWNPNVEQRWLIQLPIIRWLITGYAHVSVFFVISGYALSYKPLKLLRQGRHAEMAETLASSTMRRQSRLFLPGMAVSLVSMLMSYNGFYGPINYMGAPTSQGSIPLQLQHWAKEVMGLMNPFSHNLFRGKMFFYDPNQWTLPLEFDCSLIVFLALGAFSRLRTGPRLLFTTVMLLVAIYFLNWPVFLFVGGMMIADLHFSFDDNNSSIIAMPTRRGSLDADGLESSTSLLLQGSPSREEFAPWTNRAEMTPRTRKFAAIAAFMLCIHLLGFPEGGRGAAITTGFMTFSWLVPAHFKATPEFFWIPIGAVLLVLTIDRNLFLQKLFTNAVVQYLGRISFGIYLVHGPILWAWVRQFGRGFVEAHVGAIDGPRFVLGFLLVMCCFWPLIIVLADMVHRYVDVNAVRLGKWAYGKVVSSRK